MTDREELPTRRDGDVITFEHQGHKYHGNAGIYPDGRIGDIFLRASKTGTLLNTTMHDSAIAVSLAIQHGCPIEDLARKMLRNEDGTAAGPIGHFLDLLAKVSATK